MALGRLNNRWCHQIKYSPHIAVMRSYRKWLCRIDSTIVVSCKLGELVAGWESDLCKLRQLAPEVFRRYLVVFGFFGRPLDGSRLGLRARIAEVGGRLLFALPERPFTWRSTSLAVVRAWAWEA